MNTFDLTYLSLGAGVQSSALLAMSALGLRGCPKADVAIFADTQDEPGWVYDYIGKLTTRFYGIIPIIQVTTGKLSQSVIERHNGDRNRWTAIPVFTLDRLGVPGPLKRQCTTDYKITPIEREVRKLLGVKAVRDKKVRALIGISMDEVQRMRKSRTTWITNVYPLVESGMTRVGCVNLLKEIGLPIPKKSACVFCPYHDDAYWQDLKDNHPEEFARAVSFDKQVRNMTKSGIEQPVYLHRSLIPLEQVEFKPKNKEEHAGLWDSFSEECEGMCGV